MSRRRPGVTILETLIAIGVLSTAAVMVAQTATWSVGERTRTEDRLAAMEAATNELEAARAQSWDDLTPAWAASRKVSDSLAAQLLDGAMTVRVVPEADKPGVKRVTAEVTWTDRNGKPALPVVLTGLFAARVAGGSA
jgi:type II secretory pathway pseudopilin PulG